MRRVLTRCAVALAAGLSMPVLPVSSPVATALKTAPEPTLELTSATVPRARCDGAEFAKGSMVVAGVTRRYGVAVPKNPGRERTLLVNLHGTGGTIANQTSMTDLDDLGTAEGWVVVTPQALGSPARWNWRQDPALAADNLFVQRLIGKATAAYCLGDDARVLLVGGSNGAVMAGFFACRDSRVDGVAMVIATAVEDCARRHRFPVLTIRGTADTTVPYSSALPFTQTWVDHAGCTKPPRDRSVWPGVTRTSWKRCDDGARVALDTVQGGVHAWPGAGLRAQTNSKAGLTYPASERIVEFFVTHT